MYHGNARRQWPVQGLERPEHHPLAPDLLQRCGQQGHALALGDQAQQVVMVVGLRQAVRGEPDAVEVRLTMVMKTGVQPPFETKQRLLAQVVEGQA